MPHYKNNNKVKNRQGIAMKLSETKEAKKWLEQFETIVELNIMKSYLDSLILVSKTEFSNFVKSSVEDIINIRKKSMQNSRRKPRVALFPIPKNKKISGKKKNKRTRYSSADMIGYLTTEIERATKGVIASPTLSSMVQQKVTDLVFIDDIIGSGRSVIGCYTKYKIIKSFKSWVSYGRCNIWLISYAATKVGLSKIKNKIKLLNDRNMIIKVVHGGEKENNRLIEIFKKYANFTTRKNCYIGYGNVMANIIFEHSCPNNAPAILWSNNTNWNALFPNRGIPHKLSKCFSTYEQKQPEAEILFKSGQCKLALSLLEEMEQNKLSIKNIRLITILGLLSKGARIKKINKILTCEKKETLQTIEYAKSIGLLGEDHKITKFGKSLLDDFKQNKHDKPTYLLEYKDEFYYTTQFAGIKREI